MRKNTIIILMITCLLVSNKLFSQKSSGGIPVSIENNNYYKTDAIPTITLPSVNNDTEIALADSIENSNCATCHNQDYGIGLDVSINLKNDAQLQTLNEDGSKLWMLKVESSTAYGMQFFFNKFKIPDGATLFFYNEDKSTILGAFTSNNNPKNITQTFQFATQYISGNKIFIEYNEPQNADFEGELQISKVIHIFRDIFPQKGPFVGEGKGALACEINVACPIAEGWTKEISSVGLLLHYNSLTGYAGFCSGALINNTENDGFPYFLTANHCVEPYYQSCTLLDYSSWMVLFNHQSTQCSSDGSEFSAYTDQSVCVVSILVRDECSLTSDYCLMQLDPIPTTWGLCYSGWTKDLNSAANSTYTVGIHHPKGDIKKFSKSNNPLASYNHDYLWKVDWNWDSYLGVTNGLVEIGSSGSPLYNPDHKIIGQLLGRVGSNPINCEVQQSSGYGKFSTSWQESGTAGFAWYLDPYSKGLNSIDTYCPSVPGEPIEIITPTGSSAPNYIQIGQGFCLKGDADLNNTPCLSGDFNLSPLGANDIWKYSLTSSTYSYSDLPNNLDKDKCNRKLLEPWKCNCSYFKYFVEITEVDQNQNPIGSAYSKWFTFQAPIEYHSSWDYYTSNAGWSDYIKIRRLPINADILNQLSITLKSGSIYRIKLATSSNSWKEDVRYFKYNLEDISKSGSIQDNLYASNNINLSDATISQPITVKAGTSIHILPNTVITAGKFMIDDIGCPGANQMKMESDNNAYPFSYETDEVTEDKPVAPSSTAKVSTITVSPNPNSGSFLLQTNTAEQSEIIVYDLLGNIVYQTTATASVNIDISKHSKGVYFVKVVTNSGTIANEKIVYQ